MKKVLTIGIAILVAVVIIFIFFPGLPTYFKVKHKYEYISKQISEFETVPAGADFKNFSINGLKLKAPADWSVTDNGMKSSSGETALIVTNKDNIEQDEFLDSLKDYNPWDQYKFNEEDYQEFFRTIGSEPAKYGFSSRILFYIRDNISAADCIRLHGKNKDIFLELAELKEKAVEAETMYKLNSSYFTGYIGRMNFSEYEDLWDLFIFPKGDDTHTFMVKINYSDEITAKQIISSIELEK
ncbi:hypothetical protein [Ruminococcus sp.]|uniref:hypothetical protein n=1 Tax=Ruminococcus sp. TaxID=41978 RepID=UPI0025EFF126|nr:hypothetical protein [Ruminococcus sp.]